MAQASFFINDFTVKKDGDILIVRAQKKCIHGAVFDQIFLTMPAELAYVFNADTIEQNSAKKQNNLLAERFKRFSSDN